MDYKVFNLNAHGDERGKLVSFEKDKNIPFDVKRAFYIFDIKGSASRGCHSNHDSEFVMVAVSGSCKVLIDNGKERQEVLLDDPCKALYLGKMIWKEMFDFSEGTVLLVMANTPYNENEYIRNYDEFLKLARTTVQY